MNQAEKEIASNYGEMLIKAVDRLTTAIKYLADVQGFKADAINPKDEEGKVGVTLTIAKDEDVKTVLKDDQDATEEPVPVEVPEITLDTIKKQLNALAKKAGKQSAFDLISKYAASKKPADVDAKDFLSLFNEIEQGLAA